MDKEITTTIKKQNDSKGVDSAGEIESVTGYNIKSSQEDTNEIDPSSKDCYAKKSIFKNGDNEIRHKYYIKISSDGTIFDPWGMYSEGN